MQLRPDQNVLGLVIMELFKLAPADRRFLARSIRCHFAIWLVIGSVFTIGSLFPSPGPYAAKPQASIDVESGILAAASHVQINLPSDAHLPVGWRRTAVGWEHTSNWLSPDKSIDTWIDEQRSREPAWIQRTLALIRNTPPLVFAMLQVSMIAVVVQITTRKKLNAS